MTRNAFAVLYRRHAVISTTSNSHRASATEIILHKCVPREYLKHVEVIRRLDCWLHRNSYSTGFTSVHGETPSAEYARRRRESLENQFGHALGTYSSKSFKAVYGFGPFLALYRAAIISFHVLRLTIWRLFVQDMNKRAVKFRETLIRLGPFYIKLGQALSTRPDILPTVYCQELAKLQDQIPPFPTDVAIRSIETHLGVRIDEIFSDISPKPIAAASLGQVYKAHLHSGELVAVKVQRPGMSLLLTLDALLFHMIGGQLKRFAKARKDLLVAVNEMVRHMFDEIDYVLEGKNAERFASLYCWSASGGNIKHYRSKSIKAPKIYWDYTCPTVLTMEWIDGIKLTDEASLNKASLNRRELIDQGLYCSLRQLLEVGYFHADPHRGNLVAVNDGTLAYFDFGMMGDIPRHYRVGLIQMGLIYILFLMHCKHHLLIGPVNLKISSLYSVPSHSVSSVICTAWRSCCKASSNFNFQSCFHVATTIHQAPKAMERFLKRKLLSNEQQSSSTSSDSNLQQHELFAFLVDEARDISNKEQMAVAFRYVNKKGSIVERFLDHDVEAKLKLLR